MTLHQTANYGITYCDTDTYLGDLADVSKAVADTLDAALLRGGIAPPGASDLASLQARVAALEGRATALETATADSGWVSVTIASGQAKQGTAAPQVRKIGKMCYMRWGWTSAPAGGTAWVANTTISVGTIPAGFRPTQDIYGWCGTSSPANIAKGQVTSAGAITVTTGAAVPSFALFDGLRWTVDS